MKELLGETRSEAITRIQERLGTATSRPLAEKTFWELAKTKKITMNDDGHYLIEAVSDESMRDTAIAQFNQQNTTQKRSRGGIKHFTIDHHNMKKARVSTTWKPQNSSKISSSIKSTMSTAFAPTLTEDDIIQ